MSTRSWRRSHRAATRVGGISAAMRASNGPRPGRSRTPTSAATSTGVSKQCGNCLKPALAPFISACVSGFEKQPENGDNSSPECLNSLFDPTRRAVRSPANVLQNWEGRRTEGWVPTEGSERRTAADGGSVAPLSEPHGSFPERSEASSRSRRWRQRGREFGSEANRKERRRTREPGRPVNRRRWCATVNLFLF